MPTKSKKQVRTSRPRGLEAPGSAQPQRGNPDRLVATDIPVEVPVYVYYDRHIGPPETGRNRGTGRKLTDMPKIGQLLGWTVTVDAFTFGQKVLIKIGHRSEWMEVWCDGKKVFSTKVRAKPGSQEQPHPLPRFPEPEDDDPVLDDDDDFEEEV